MWICIYHPGGCALACLLVCVIFCVGPLRCSFNYDGQCESLRLWNGQQIRFHVFIANQAAKWSRGLRMTMHITVILMVLLLISLIISGKKNYKGLSSFDRATTLPLRGLLALLIISHHLGQHTDIYPISQFTAGIGLQIVAVFFFISGYGLCVSYLSKGRSYLDGFLQKRMGKLLPEFIVLTLGMVLAYHFFSSLDIATQAIKIACGGWTPLPHSWFIYAIIYVYIAFYLCCLIFESPKYIGVLFTVAIIFYIVLMAVVFKFPAYWFLTIITVSLGYFVALYEKRFDNLLNHRFAAYPALAVLLLISYCAMAKIRIEFITVGLIEIWIIVQTISVYIIVRTLGFMQWKWLCGIGAFSLELYLIHGLPLMSGRRLGLDNWTLWFFTSALSIPSAILLNRVYDLLFRRQRRLS